MRFLPKALLSVAFVSQALVLSSCSSLGYYGQSISGQLQLIRAQRDFEAVYADPSVSRQLKQRLRKISLIRDFASDVLTLPDNDSYRSFADIGRRYIVWNVFATPRLSLEPYKSCFPVIGCLNYRGYFRKHDAIRYMQELEQREHDVYLGGVSAYSTLGWFKDPILNGMLERSDVELARLIFHELAHQRLYVRDDTDFNEAFAEAVARIGVELWLTHNSAENLQQEFRETLKRENDFNTLVLDYREKLIKLFQSETDDRDKLTRKNQLLAALKLDYQVLRSSWGNNSDYDNWVANVNNARIAAVASYQSLVPDFLHAYQILGSRLETFYKQVDSIADCPKNRRRQLLHARHIGPDCKASDQEQTGN